MNQGQEKQEKQEPFDEFKFEGREEVYMPCHIANAFLEKSFSTKFYDKYKIDNLMLNKLVYLTYGYGLALLKQKIFYEDIQAWQYGPVIPSIYHEFKSFKKKTIDRLGNLYDYESENEILVPVIPKSDHEVLEIVDGVYEKYRKYSSYQLVNITHQIDSPWDQTFDGTLGKVIPTKVIYDYFFDLIKDVPD